MKSTKKSFIKTLFLRILSLAIAFVIWLIVANVDDYKIVKEIDKIPVTQLNGESIEAGGLVYDVTSGETVDILVEGRRSVVDKLTKNDFTAVADLSKLSYTNTAKINVKAVSTSVGENVTISVVDNAMVLSIEEKKSRQFEVKVDTKGEPAEGYALGSYETNPVVINVTGPQSLVNKIRYARCVVDVTDKTESIDTEVRVYLYDGNDEVMSSSRITADAETVRVKMQIFETKVVPVKFFTTGKVADGFKLTGLIGSVEEIRITGPQLILDSISYIAVNDIDISGISEETDFDRNISNFLPDGVYLADSVDRVIVTASVEELVVKTFNLSISDIELKNTDDELYDYSLVIQGAYVISLSGLEADVSGVTLADLHPVIDCKDLKPGTETVKVILTKNNKYTVTENGTVTLVIKEKTTEAEDGETTSEEEGN